ncbi:PA14 domain-containing protein [Tateyamaria sp. syn59]|uniref:PA14 domain-containing protein n=1 Tax=Tateyamaria sp. syn59 TaxID=2576942 RepID=UPI0011BF69AB|nr:PA14 domain-containing protein [Tateyamaria sp. syn59]
MKMLTTAALAAISYVSATALFAAPLKLEPADPQPEALSQGLSVVYNLDENPRSIDDALDALDAARPGKPLLGMDYRDTADGDETLTSGQAHKVVAGISGYVRFDEAGTYLVDFMSNDGLMMSIGGQEVAFFDGVHPCEATETVEVEVPEAGWYEMEGVYFQRKGTACLLMRAGIGEPVWIENESFGYME